MKTIKSALLMLSLLALSFSSCKKDNDTEKDDADDVLRSAAMTFKIDGTAKTSTHLFAAREEGSIEIYGGINETETMALLIYDFNGTGDYAVDGDNVQIYYVNGTDPLANSFLGQNGTIKITSVTDKEVKGTFVSSLKNTNDVTKAVSDGKFEAKIIDVED